MPKQYNCQARLQAFVYAYILIDSNNHQIAAWKLQLLVLKQLSQVYSEFKDWLLCLKKMMPNK